MAPAIGLQSIHKLIASTCVKSLMMTSLSQYARLPLADLETGITEPVNVIGIIISHNFGLFSKKPHFRGLTILKTSIHQVGINHALSFLLSKNLRY